MQAIQVSAFGDESVLQLKDLPTPKPGLNQALVALKAIGVNPVDTYIRAGKYPSLPPLPYTPGTDAAGIVEAAGAGSPFHAGDRVYLTGSLTGAYASHALVSTAVTAVGSHIHPLPDHVSFEAGAALYVPYYTAYKALFLRTVIKPGDTVLIHGATGAVGLAALQWLKNSNTTVLATGGSQEGLDLLKKEGAHHIFNHKNPNYIEEIKSKVIGGIDVILEMLANVNLANDLKLLGKHGRVIVIGNRGDATANLRDIMAKDADIRPMSLPASPPEHFQQIHKAVAAALAAKSINPIISKTYKLADAGQAHKDIMNSSANGKLILVP